MREILQNKVKTLTKVAVFRVFHLPQDAPKTAPPHDARSEHGLVNRVLNVLIPRVNEVPGLRFRGILRQVLHESWEVHCGWLVGWLFFKS